MNSAEIRQTFLDFFEGKGHKIVPSAPIVVKNDPTLMFTNAGMNQFKDFFLGNRLATETRIANTQKCLRVSGKHNDLEEVGVDTYHHTMFEMLGNWSFGDYFKQDAINWAWELLTEVYKLDKSRLYVTVFEGSEADKLDYDAESYNLWEQHIDKDRILRGNKKDNFWEMGDTGPCGPCSEIHFDLRPESDRALIDGKTLVNNDHPQVIEIWNLVFMQFNRKADGSLENLPGKHVDTGMGFERLVRCIHGKASNYDTDIFMDTIQELQKISGKIYGNDEKTDIAFRVIADHIRAICFAIADGQLPSNTGGGYVIRRILRRAVRYGYSSLGFKDAEIFKLVEPLSAKFATVFPDLAAQKDFVAKVIKEEEKTFLKTLATGLNELDQFFNKNTGSKEIAGSLAFYYYDTLGFPLDLTRLIAKDFGYSVDETGFEKALAEQKQRSRKDAEKTTGDWVIVRENEDIQFIGYDFEESVAQITRFRTIQTKGKQVYQVVFSPTPFYAESGGQVGDTGTLTGLENQEKINVIDTTKENNLIVHSIDKLPENPIQDFKASINSKRRSSITKNHSATHLLHAALQNVLGKHIMQKGSLVDADRLRFDFSHMAKITADEMNAITEIVSARVSQNIALDEKREVPIEIAKEMGATALFGEKYGDFVRVITFDPDFSMELCGGTHVKQTGDIGQVFITAETAVAAGVRRIEAITGEAANQYLKQHLDQLDAVKAKLNNPPDLLRAIDSVLEENNALRKQLEKFEQEKTGQLKSQLKSEIQANGGINFLVKQIEIGNADQLKDLCFQLKNETENIFLVLGCIINEKPLIAVSISDSLVSSKSLNAGQLIRDWAKLINGGGGGQPFYASAGGKDVNGLKSVIDTATEFAAKL